VCAALAEAAPDRVAGVDSRAVDSAGVALAWGDPAIVVRCAVPPSPALRPGVRCDTVDSVDWFTRQEDGGYRFSTVGRAVTVELFVPYEYDPAGDALVDVAAAVRGAVPLVDGCR